MCLGAPPLGAPAHAGLLPKQAQQGGLDTQTQAESQSWLYGGCGLTPWAGGAAYLAKALWTLAALMGGGTADFAGGWVIGHGA